LSSSRWGLVLKFALSLGILLWFALTVDWSRLVRLTSTIQWVYLLPLAALSLARVWISAVRFRCLIAGSIGIGIRALVGQYLVASYFNNLLPSALGGDLVRLFMLADSGLAKRESGVLILVERFAGSAALLALAGVGAMWFPVPLELRLVVLALAAVVLALLLVLMAVPQRLAFIPQRWPGLARSYAALASVTSRPGLLAVVFTLSLILQTVSISVSWLVAQALGIQLSFIACLALVPLVWLVTLLPISIGGIGLREASFAYFLGTAGVSTEESLLISLGTFASLVFNGSIGGLLLASRTVTAGTDSARAPASGDADGRPAP